MKQTRTGRAVVFLGLLLAAWLPFGDGLAGAENGPPVAIRSPYAEIDWDSFGQYKANLHTHTLLARRTEDGRILYVDGELRDAAGEVLREGESGHSHRRELQHPEFAALEAPIVGGSDGRLPATQVIDLYRELGYSILALTDHNRVTWPWDVFGRNPEELGLLAVQGNELSRHHHTGSFFNDYDGAAREVDEGLDEADARNGLAMLFHPGRYDYDLDWYLDLFERHDHLVGIEVYNLGDRYPGDRDLWDRLLTRLMPERPVWGFSNDDLHFLSHLGRNWQMFLLPELTEEALREAMMHGRFYFAYTPGRGDPAPLIHSVAVDPEAGSITLLAEGYTNAVWISEGRVVASGPDLVSFPAARALPGSERGDRAYVRAVLEGPSGRTYTQPFFVTRKGRQTP